VFLGLRYRWNWIILLIGVMASFSARTCWAASASRESRPIRAYARFTEPYCGLYCVYFAMRMHGRDVSFRDLLDAKYLPKDDGSPLSKLRQAAEDHGMHGVILDQMSSRDLRSSPHPVVLHTRGRTGQSIYDHYVLYVGEEVGKARFIDPADPAELKKVPFVELVKEWDGYGLILAPTEIDVDRIVQSSRLVRGAWGIAFIFVVLLVRWYEGRREKASSAPRVSSRLMRSGLQCGTILTVSVLASMVYHALSEEGLLAQSGASASVALSHAGGLIPELSADAVKLALDSGATVIDARAESSYRFGHLPGAINVPLYARSHERRRILEDVPKSSKIIVYCQSNRCDYAVRIGVWMIEEGYTDVAVFKGGWQEWNARD